MYKLEGYHTFTSLEEGASRLSGNRGTIDQIFTLRNILEQVNQWNATLYTYFIDFEKALDSAHRESLWNITSMYGIPEELITVVKALDSTFKCAVLEDLR